MIEDLLSSFHFYFLSTVIQGLVLALIILFKKPVKYPSLFLGLSILLVSLSLLHGVLEESIHVFNARFPIPMNLGFAIAPLGLLHVESIIFPSFKFDFRKMLHFIPTVLFDIFLFSLFFGYVRYHMEWAMQHVEEIQFYALILGGIMVIQTLVYFVVTCRKIVLIMAKWELNSTISRWLIIGLASWIPGILFLLIAIPVAITNIELFDEYSYLIYKPVGLISAITIYLVGYLYLLKFRTIVNQHLIRIMNARHLPDEVGMLAKQLKELLDSSRIYQDSRLNVKKLAQQLNWSEKDVSYIINVAFAMNFNDLINHYRIMTFKEMVRKPQSKKYSLLGIANESGFNSKASFYRAFKKECGQTPSEYLAEQSISLTS